MRTDTRRAFSLIELVLVLVVMGVVFSVAAVRNSGSVIRQRAELLESKIGRDIRLAEQDAWYSGQARQIVFDEVNDTYELVGMADPRGNPYVVAVSAPPYSLSLSGVEFGGDATIELDGRGTSTESGTLQVSLGALTLDTSIDVRSILSLLD